MRQLTTRILWAGLLWMLAGARADAQSLGAFSWQLQPFCNIVTVNVAQNGGVYTMDGYDNQCGGAQRAAVVGLATPNPDGSIGVGLTVVSAPGGIPVHVEATISAPGYSGTWRDSAGRTGAFVLGGAGSGSPRPLTGGVGAGAVNPAEVQLRVGAACPAGQAVSAINQDGTLVCVAGGGASGDITAVTAGAGLTGGATSGAATLAVAFGADGTATSVARSDHRHVAGTSSVAVGPLALASRTSGDNNVAVGQDALRQLTSGANNVAVGAEALASIVDGTENTAIGDRAGFNNTGSRNVFVGGDAGDSNGSGNGNTVIGYGADVAPGLTEATALGAHAFATQSFTMVLGSVAGVNGATTTTRVAIGQNNVDASDRLTVNGNLRVGQCVRDGSGTQLVGTCPSDRRFKQDITPFAPMLSRVAALRPVHYFWRNQEFPNRGFGASRTYGLIAQEVEQVLPELVSTDAEGFRAVNYSQLPLLAIQAIGELKAWNDEMERRVEALEAARRRGSR